ncbi:MAG: FGGY family carbohydrate kinase [Chitinophagaceae bacterium]
MPITPVIAIFDIGKTNKKLFLFDEQYQMVLEKTGQFEETTDEDGEACENLSALTEWVQGSLDEITARKDILLKAVNFSTYGASFVHVNREGKPVTPLYNYLKKYPDELQQGFYKKYGGEITFSMHTASPVLGSLNSGLQLYRFKEERPALYDSVHYSLHLPQYMSFLLTGRPYSDITSIGCHTAMWNFPQNRYHEWLYREGISDKLAPIFPSDQVMNTQWKGQQLLSGVGLHDSSAALIPYLSTFKDPFVLISTGTWCISLNPFNQTRLTVEELQQDCLCYMEYRGRPVKASRLFAGYEHEQQTKKLAAHFQVAADYYKTVQPDAELIARLSVLLHQPAQQAVMMQGSVFGQRDLAGFTTYEEAYHQLVFDLITQQVSSTNLVLNNCHVKSIFVDGGFGRNAIYMQLLAAAYPQMQVYAASVAQATAMGAALAIHPYWNKNNWPAELIVLKQYAASQPIAL